MWDVLTRYPRKYARELITPFDTDGYGGVNTNDLDWWDEYDVPSLPELDFTTLKSSAQATGTYFNTSANPFRIPADVPSFASKQAMDYTWYFEDTSDGVVNVKWTSSDYIIGDIIVKGTTASIINLRGGGSLVTTEKIPSRASLEYKHPDALSLWKSKGWTDGGNYTFGGGGGGEKLKLKGFLYTDGDVNGAGSSDIYGAAWINGKYIGTGNLTIWFNESLTIDFLKETPTRQSWTEFVPGVWDTPNW